MLKTTHISFALLTICLTVFASCGDSPGSCKSDDGHFCIDYIGSDYDVAGAQDDCDTQTDGVYSSDECDDEEVLGTCLLDEEKSTEREYLYYEDTDFDVTAAEAACTLLEGNFEEE